jgi:hypothetical protein
MSIVAEAMAKRMSSPFHKFDDFELQLADECSQFYNNPLGWVLWAFDWDHGDLSGFDGPDIWQREFLSRWGDEIKDRGFNGILPVLPIRFTTASGHGIGKSALTAWIILFIMSTRPYAKGIVTANTGDQLKTKTWSELGKWKERCLTGHWFEYNSGKGSLSMYHKSFPESWRVDGQTSRDENSEAFAGLHAANSTPFYLFDEASRISRKIWEVAEGGLTDGEPMFFAFGNPTRNDGVFYDTFHTLSHRWIQFRVDSRTAKMTNKGLIKTWEDDWGEDSDFFRVRVRGLFPRAGDMQFIPSDVTHAAMKRGSGQYLSDEPLIMGFDVSRGGEDSCVIQMRRGKDANSEKVYIIPGEKSRDSMVVVSKLIMVIDRHKPDVIFIDATGIGGPIGDRLRQLGYNAIDVHFGGVADDDTKFKNKTAEMGYRCRQWLIEGGSIHDNPELEKQLTNREYGHDDKDRLVLERKIDMRTRLGYSPDWADALYLTFAQAVPKLKTARNEFDGMRPHQIKDSNYDPFGEL